jgi:CRISPR/Cas system CSM-associated protein Csm4 (group 5 of RAMP superfamily)
MAEEIMENQNINVLELLLKISNDVSAIKTDVTNLKMTQSKDRLEISKEIEDVKSDCFKEISNLEKDMMSRVNNMQSVQNTLVGDIDTLKHADEVRDAKKWRTVIAFIATALGGMFIAKLPDIISYMILLNKVK